MGFEVDERIHECMRDWGWVFVAADVSGPGEILPDDLKGGYYLRFANFMDQDCDTHRIHYCPVCGLELDV